MSDNRLLQIRRFLSDNNLEAFLITKHSSLRYIFGFTGSSGIGWITHKATAFLTDSRYKVQASKEVYCDDLLLVAGPLFENLPKFREFTQSKRIGFESDDLSFRLHQKLTSILDPSSSLLPFEDVFDKLASVKTPEELTSIKTACDITVQVFMELLSDISEGVSENDIAAEISYKIRKNGGDKDSFDPIVLFGRNTAMPHGTPGKTKLQNGNVIQLDFGAVYNGYHSDFSRVIGFGGLPGDYTDIHKIVRTALEEAIEAVETGRPAKAIDTVARDSIDRAGYGKYFGHALGHGVGLDIHAFPKISPSSADTLQSGNVFTLEPGIYIPEKFGIRLENVISIDGKTVSNLTNIPLEIVQL